MAEETLKTEQADAQPSGTNLSPGEAAELMESAVSKMRQQWLQTAVHLGGVLKNGQSISLGAIEDLRRLREKFEELERARLFLRNMGSSASQGPVTGDGKDEGS